MSPDDIDEWLDIWVEDHLDDVAADAAAAAARCQSEAQAAGIAPEALRRACGGDVAEFLAEEWAAIRRSGGNG